MSDVTCLNCTVLRRELTGMAGENMGLRVTAGFFEERCNVLEASTVRTLTMREHESMQGCCPLCALKDGEVIAERISLFVRDYIKRWADTSDEDGPLIDELADAIRRGDWRSRP